VGKVTQIDKESATVIVRLTKKRSELPQELFVRNRQFIITAHLRPSGVRTGLSVGTILLRGDPKPGEEVYERIIP